MTERIQQAHYLNYINYLLRSTITTVEDPGFTSYTSPMASSSKTKKSRARRVWQLLFDFLISSAPRALNSLRQDEGRTMRSLADEWRCDASNATWIIDRLEHAGLAVRRAAPNDRRVKLVLLTPKGVRVKNDVMEAFYTAPPELLALDSAELAALERLLHRLTRTP